MMAAAIRAMEPPQEDHLIELFSKLAYRHGSSKLIREINEDLPFWEMVNTYNRVSEGAVLTTSAVLSLCFIALRLVRRVWNDSTSDALTLMEENKIMLYVGHAIDKWNKGDREDPVYLGVRPNSDLAGIATVARRERSEAAFMLQQPSRKAT
jgi:hypothetical protein